MYSLVGLCWQRWWIKSGTHHLLHSAGLGSLWTARRPPPPGPSSLETRHGTGCHHSSENPLKRPFTTPGGDSRVRTRASASPRAANRTQTAATTHPQAGPRITQTPNRPRPRHQPHGHTCTTNMWANWTWNWKGQVTESCRPSGGLTGGRRFDWFGGGRGGPESLHSLLSLPLQFKGRVTEHVLQRAK